MRSFAALGLKRSTTLAAEVATAQKQPDLARAWEAMAVEPLPPSAPVAGPRGARKVQLLVLGLEPSPWLKALEATLATEPWQELDLPHRVL